MFVGFEVGGGSVGVMSGDTAGVSVAGSVTLYVAGTSTADVGAGWSLSPPPQAAKSRNDARMVTRPKDRLMIHPPYASFVIATLPPP